MPIRSRTFLIFLCLPLSWVHAQTPTLPSTGTVVDVVAEPVPLEMLAGSVTSLSRTDILNSGARDVSELLRFVPSVHLSENGGKGSLSTISIRGGKPNFTLVLIDGIPANDIGDQLGGAFNFSTLDLNNIKRIDIFRGPLSTLYGSEALGGVINIVLREAAEMPRFQVGVEAGQYHYTRVQAGATQKLAGFNLAATGSYSRIGQQVFEDGSMLGTSAVSADRSFGSDKSLHGFARWNRLYDSNLPISSGGPLYALLRAPEINMADQVSTGAQFHHTVRPWWSYAASGGVFSRVSSDNSPAILDQVPPGPSYVPSSLSSTRFLRIDTQTTQQIAPRPWLQTYSTLSLIHEDGTTKGTLGGILPGSYQSSRTTFNLSEAATASSRQASVTAGLNLQNSNDYGVVLSPRVGGIYRLSQYRFHFSYGQGFKLPSFYSLGNPLIGNPKLQPETGHAYDTGIAHEVLRTHTKLALTYFNNSYGNLIDFSPAIFKLVNRENAFARGADLDIQQQFHWVTLGGAVTYVDAGLAATSDRLRDVPRWAEELQAHIRLPKAWTVMVAATWVGRRFDYQVPVPQIATVPRYTTTNVKVDHTFNHHIGTQVRFENILNSKYQEFVGFPSSGINVSTGVFYSR